MSKLHTAIITLVLTALPLSSFVLAEENSIPPAPAESAAPADNGVPAERNGSDPENGSSAKPPSRAALRAKVRSYRLEQMELLRQQQMSQTPSGKKIPN